MDCILQSTPTCSLTDLPPEILSSVCFFLSSQARQQVILVCRRLKTICEPFLYKTVVLNSQVSTRDQDILRLEKFMANVRRRPELRLYINALIVHISYGDFEGYNELLQWLPNLRFLELDPPYNDLRLHHLNRLESLFLDCRGYDVLREHQCTTLPELIARHLWMPALKRLEAHSLYLDQSYDTMFASRHDDTLATRETKNVQRTSPVTTLRFWSCSDLGFDVLPDVLRSLKALENFAIVIYFPWEIEHPPIESISPVALSRALQPHMETLVELIIAGNDMAEFPDTSLFGTLAHCRHLKRVAMPEHFLVSGTTSMFHHLLPSQLEALQLQYPMGLTQGLDDQRKIRHLRMHSLASAKSLVLPGLKQVIWWYQQAECWSEGEGDPTRYGGNDVLLGIAGRFKDVNVHFRWLSQPYFDRTPFGGYDFESGQATQWP